MMKRWTLMLAFAGTAWSGAAHADQCIVTSERIATAAAKLINSHHEIVRFCEPCGDKAPGQPEKATAQVSPYLRLFEVHVGGQPTDLAYTFVPTSPRQYQSLAALTGCEVGGVSLALRVTDETAHGVMIVPEPAAIPEPPQSELAAVLEPIAPTYVTLPPQFVVVAQPEPHAWWPAAVAGGGGASAIWAAWAVLTTRRRRRTMVPRAAALIAGDHRDPQ
ncbi:MAG: hypothetical protein JWO36_4906 [Myxococcales bacterium]|nr:hypothetical protein [Myxococcales bacterium]